MQFKRLAAVAVLLICHTVNNAQNGNENICILLKDKITQKSVAFNVDIFRNAKD